MKITYKGSQPVIVPDVRGAVIEPGETLDADPAIAESLLKRKDWTRAAAPPKKESD